MRTMRLPAVAALTVLLVLAPGRGSAQQFNSDNYLAMPHGTVTALATTGTEYSALLTSFALFPRWEFFLGAFMYWEKDQQPAHFNKTYYVKYMPYENKAKNGGFGIAAGSGSYPGYYTEGKKSASFKSFWAIPQGTIPFWNGTVSLDLNPGVVVNTDYSDSDKHEWGFTYSSRLAVYKVVPQSAIVGEVFGAAGGAYATPQYRVGVRWEPSKTFVAAVSWAAGFNGSTGGGAEIGFMIFSPPYVCFKGCKADLSMRNPE